MDIQTLDQALSIVDGKLTLTADTIPGLSLQPFLSAYNADVTLIISNALKQTTSDTVTITGSSAFMRVATPLEVRAVFRIDASGTPVAELRFNLIGDIPGPNAWHFSTSFPDLPLFLDYSKSLTQPQRNLLDELQLSNASFVFTTQSGMDEVSAAPLMPGLNFIGTLKPQGLLGLFDTLLGGDQKVTLYGLITVPTPNQITPVLPIQTYPWQTQWSVPGILLQAGLGIDLTISKLKLEKTSLIIYTPLTNAWLMANESYQPVTAVRGSLEIPSAALAADVVAELTRGYAYVPIVAYFQGADLSNLTQLVDLANGNDLFDLLPDEIKNLLNQSGGLSLERAAIGLSDSVAAEAVDYVSVTVGMPKLQWTIFSGLTVESIAASFIINSPFVSGGRTASVIVEGNVDVAGTQLDIATQLPDFTVWAELQDGDTLPLADFFKQYVPELPAPPGLAVSELQLVVTPGVEYSFTARIDDDPPWTLDLGPTALSIADVRLALTKQESSSAQGTFNGVLVLGQDLVELTTSYTLPGGFFIRADLPDFKLSSLIALFNEMELSLPAAFDLDLKQSYVLIEQQAGGLTFSVATDLPDLGLLAFTVQKQGQWGFALGVDLATGNIARLPGLEILAAFESFVGLDTLLLVVTSLGGQTGFQFPDTAHFNQPSLGTKNITLPPQANGLVRGLNIYAQLSTTNSAGFKALASYLGIRLDGTVGITIAVSLPDPTTNSKLFLSVDEEIQKGTTLVGELGGLLQGSDVGAFLTAIVKTQVQGQPLEFDVTAVVLEDGVLISGTVLGTIQFDTIQLSNLALIIGLDFEGIPSLGIAATLDIRDFDSSLALFFDSTDPAKSLVAGAISNVTLLNIARTLAGQQNIPSGLETVLNLVGLKELAAFQMPASVGTSLDNRDLGTISHAFKQYGSVTIPATSDRVLLVINEKGSSWHLTALSTMQHYSLMLLGSNIAVALQPQLYVVPETTFIGSIQYPQGFNVVAEIDFLLIQAQIKIEISANQGIVADVKLAPIVLLSKDFFSISGASDQGGPQFSLATYSQPNLTDPRLRDPHFLITGILRVLGTDIASIYLLINEHGLTFDVSEQVNPLLHVELHGTIDSTPDLDAGGSVVVGIRRSLDLGQLGNIQVNVDVNGSLTVSYKAGMASATLQGGFAFQGIQGTIPTLTLDANSTVLQNIGDTIWSQVSDIISKSLKNPDQWLTWVHTGVIQGAGQEAGQVGQILSSVYQLSADEIAAKTQQILGYGIQSITEALKGAGSTANDAVNALRRLGFQSADIGRAIQEVFTNTHADVNTGHIDTPAGPHIDTASTHLDIPLVHVDTTNHIDVPRSHIDSTSHADFPGTHTDFNTAFGHADQNITPHGDSNPHADQTTTPHGDSNPHADQVTTPHSDTSTQHVDSTTPPHGDTSSHIDVQA
ncbi:hypothetical protein KDH_08980 [Dictyobacter sp. S3.2.2.5]|uniref:Uncharacterized protein n=1 Tax=Dictyobacter halimunensis TaxID=3026934 RepID=A0ABQ6FIR7_9CHLR|nr:hypothetical protein KDH_08980 [Dictyobacter sp. S3.2.2.5]